MPIEAAPSWPWLPTGEPSLGEIRLIEWRVHVSTTINVTDASVGPVESTISGDMLVGPLNNRSQFERVQGFLARVPPRLLAVLCPVRHPPPSPLCPCTPPASS